MVNAEEQQYLNLIQHIINHGEDRPDRTGTGVLSIFAPSPLKFSLRNNTLPLLTTKRVFIRGVIEELLWFIRGETDSLKLKEKNIHIWDANGSREYLDSIGLTKRQEGDLGPIYGFQWRHFGAEYIDCKTNYTGQGVDQLANIIKKIQTSPYDRRLILSAWNPADLEKMALPPCHMFCQFYVHISSNDHRPELSCQLYQRSCDMGLGVPFNIASYALLTCMIAHVCNLDPGDFTHVMGDCHIYKNHIAALQQQLTRSPRPFPTLSLNRSITDIEDFTLDDFIIENYHPYETIKMKMSV
ncbi:hypothetical protein MERGE_001573 [Pneumocystis wakefieldiae]|uniref:thymidylate synthase n=1 Tax=Pneumocystis wakefieldiae TaxID=38082 RepID=A0A899G3M5_9ASCO|nr:hypothetical protein MERGE_001573 [Pneumocystis wakefieldiae]